MAIKRYTADADNTITNALMDDLSTRATGSNMGASDVLEVFSIYGQATSSAGSATSAELSRVLIKFPIDDVSTDRTNNNIPSSGSVNFYLRMFNARHSQTTPRDITLEILPITSSWQEGTGLDMEEYTDLTHGNAGSNWMSASNTAGWTVPGGDFHSGSNQYTASFTVGNENLEVEITELVEEWIDGGTITNYGVCLKLLGTQEAYYSSSALTSDNSVVTPANEDSLLFNLTGSTKSYYTKKFFGRGSEFFYKRPYIEARWDSSIRDRRGSFYYSSSLAPAEDNLNTIYLYNYVRGRLRNIPGIGDGAIYVDLYSGSDGPSELLLQSLGNGITNPATGGLVPDKTGIYSASVCLTAASDGTLSKVYDVWHGGDGGDTYHTGTIYPLILSSSQYNPSTEYATSITNLRPIYHKAETARFRIFVRKKDWSPTIYSKATKLIQPEIVESGSYRIYRIIDELNVIAHNTGSDLATRLSYDATGSYFDLDVSLLQSDYAYGISLAYYNDAIGSWVEQRDKFKFRVE